MHERDQDPDTESPGSLAREVVQALYERHGRELLLYLIGILRDAGRAEELLQQVFVRCLEGGDRVREEARRAWLFRVAHHEALAWKRRRRLEERGAERLFGGEAFEVTPGDVLARAEDVERTRRAIARLPEAQREILVMRIRRGLTFAEIAEELELPLGTVLTRMRLATEKLRRWLAS